MVASHILRVYPIRTKPYGRTVRSTNILLLLRPETLRSNRVRRALEP